MARKEIIRLAERELQIMKVVWRHGPATVREVQEALHDTQPLAYTTVLTMMRILEQKGYLEHKEQDRTFVYHARVTESQASRSLVRDLVERVFDGSPGLLVQRLLAEEQIPPEELERLKQMIAEKEKGA